MKLRSPSVDPAVLAGQPQERIGRDIAPAPEPRVGPGTVQEHRPRQAAHRLERGHGLEPGDLAGEDGAGQGRRSNGDVSGEVARRGANGSGSEGDRRGSMDKQGGAAYRSRQAGAIGRLRPPTMPHPAASRRGTSGWKQMGIILWLIIGAIAGWIAGNLMRGGGFGVLGNIVVGIVGAMLGGWVFGFLGIGPEGGVIGSLITAVVGACLLLFIVSLVKRA